MPAPIHAGASLQGVLHDVTDTLAFMVRTLLEEMGLRVPEDVQLIGFDGTKWLNNLESSGYLCSTIVQPIESIAEMSVGLPVTFAEGGTTKSGSHT